MAFGKQPVLLHIFPTFDSGGAQTRLVTLANHFGPRLRHRVIAMDGRYGAIDQVQKDVEFVPLPSNVKKNTLTGNITHFRRILKSRKPKLLITHNWGSIEWAMAKIGTGIRHIHIEDGFGPTEASRQIPRRIWARRLLLRNSDVVVPSLTLKQSAKMLWHVPDQNIHYIPNGIDIERFSRVTDARASDHYVPVIGTVAALRAEKNLTRLLLAFAIVSTAVHCKLTIIGDGPEREVLMAKAKALNISDRVTFAGHASDPSRLYSSFDIFALTSDTEQMPYTVLEAMAAGCAIVGTDVGDVKQMLSSVNAPYVVPRNDRAIAEAIMNLLENDELRRKIGQANVDTVKAKYSQEAMFKAFANLYGFPDLVAA